MHHLIWSRLISDRRVKREMLMRSSALMKTRSVTKAICILWENKTKRALAVNSPTWVSLRLSRGAMSSQKLSKAVRVAVKFTKLSAVASPILKKKDSTVRAPSLQQETAARLVQVHCYLQAILRSRRIVKLQRFWAHRTIFNTICRWVHKRKVVTSLLHMCQLAKWLNFRQQMVRMRVISILVKTVSKWPVLVI